MKLRKLLVCSMMAVCVMLTGCSSNSKEQDSDAGDNKQIEESSNSEDEESNEPVSIWIVGDSTAAENIKNRNSEGWGAMLQNFITSDVVVRNAAVNGASSSSYLQGGTFEMLMDGLHKDDYVIVQFGHNDVWYEDRRTDPYADSTVEGSYKNLLKHQYIKPINEKGAVASFR